MKKVLYLLLAGTLLMGPTSCKKDDPAGPTLVTAPEANAADDNKSGGVYKGAIIGSSGTIKIVLQGGKKEIILKIDGVTKTLTTGDLDGWTSGEEIVNADFALEGWSVTLSLTADGSGGDISFDIPGHANIVVALAKERSDELIKAFEGTYAGSDSGTWNFIVGNNQIIGVSRSASNDVGYFTGSVSGNTISVTVGSSNTVAVGTVNGNSVTGTWSESADFHGTWTGTRTM